MDSNETNYEYGIGIDTGGTYTDAVLMDLRTGQVLATSKHPTVHYDLGQGIAAALDEVLAGQDAGRVKLAAFSTTLATNAMVEEQGADVGLIVLGYDKHFELPVRSLKHIEGGHDYRGNERCPLDVEKLMEAVMDFRGQVDAYVVAGAMSLLNPAHEQVAAKAIELLDPKPVFCSYQVSELPGVVERASTAVLHARLMPVIEVFVQELEKMAQAKALSADVRLIRGDGVAVSLQDGIDRAGCTVASGPAATAWFGARSVDVDRALVVDVGGTTTDVTLVEHGSPIFSSKGNQIGKWQTHIDAVEMDTAGVGGDSLAAIDARGHLQLGPGRVKPVCMSGGLTGAEEWIGTGNCCKLVMADPGQDAAGDPVLLRLQEGGPATPAQLVKELRITAFALEKKLERLVFHRQVEEIGFTPTDALHVLGRISLGDTERALAAARVLSGLREQSVEEFCTEVVRRAQKKIEAAVVAHALRRQTGSARESFLVNDQQDALVSVSFRLHLPIIGLGAAAHALLPEVAEELGTELVFPPHYEVGNAVGAIWIALNGRKEQ